jgi:diketogulonate reductase-like aldo/keto reductase
MAFIENRPHMPIDRRQFLHSMAALGAANWIGVGSIFEARQASTMITRRIPRTGEEIPVVGMGTWQTFDPSPATPAALDRLAEVLRVFIAGGGRVIDSSPMYGRSEEHTGSLLQRLRATDSMWIATKVWTNGASAGRRQLDTSSRLFHRERLDLEQVHNLVDWRAQLDMLRKAKQEGRIRYVGITHYTESSFGELEKIVRTEHVDFVQLPYSVGFRAAESRLLPAAADTGTAVIVNEPFQGGDLFASARGKALPEWAAPFASSWAQLFLKFILSHPAVTCVIPATANPDHMRDDLAAGVGPMLGADERTRLLRALGAR